MQDMSATLAGIYTNVLTNIDSCQFSAISKNLKNDHGIKTIGEYTTYLSALKGAMSRYIKSFSWFPLNWRKPQNDSFLTYKINKEVKITKNGLDW